MSSHLLCIDHPVLAVRDLQAACRLFDSLGFTVPPQGRHLEWGTGNICIMFESDYLEIRGIVDASRYTHHLDEFLEKREGLMGVAFGTDDADAIQRRLCRISGASPRMATLTRRFKLPEGEAFPKFKLVYFEDGVAPGLMTTVACQHLTPELIRRPNWLEHRNSVVGVKSLTSVVDDPGLVLGPYKALLGDDAVVARNGVVEVRLSTGAYLEFCSLEEAEAAGKVLPDVEPPYLSCTTLSVADIRSVASILHESGFRYSVVSSKKIRLAPDTVCGMILFFEESDAATPVA